MEDNQREKRSGFKKLLIIAVIVIIAIAGYWVFKKPSSNSIVDATKYQAVFLSNGQTYFGKVVDPNEKYIALTDVYYLVLKQPLQSQKNDAADQDQDRSKAEYTLIKLGKEMHGPTSMSINKDQILFIENLADDSRVVSAIKNTQK
ncbi:MAG: hypothetical protein COX31_03620 [Candidatus Moranbacteria bacterium CG23_combo_of_CG06-09_8_20_14_all_40_16]|nr:MAG: hypothetical protein COX31_03620 [Candidatus Moranbacteria bacterium CG23_combo_of_CG06-09_8_20_14_all_40_16]